MKLAKLATKRPRFARLLLLASLVAPLFAGAVAGRAQTIDYDAWPLLADPFPSTGGGGIMIGGYRPVVDGGLCRTDFTATTPSGDVYRNEVEFDALRVAGGVLCANGRWRAKDGSASGTTPFEVFIRDGVMRMKP